MTRCPEGHFYDPSKHSACPWCALPPDREAGQKTRPLAAPAPPPLPQPSAPNAAPPNAPPPPSAPAPAAGPHPNATVRVGNDARASTRRDPVVGWLVCLQGPDKGRDFRLHAEKNFIGRSSAMDVAIESDNTVSRDRHAVVIFDPKKKAFWALPGEASGLVYLNGDMVNSPMPMKADDLLEVGQTKLVLVPFCGDRYNWAEPADK